MNLKAFCSKFFGDSGNKKNKKSFTSDGEVFILE